MRHSHNAIHTLNTRAFSRLVSDAVLTRPGSSAPVCPPLHTLSTYLPDYFSSLKFLQLQKSRTIQIAPAGIAQMAVVAINKFSAQSSEWKRAGATAEANLNAPQSNREVTKTNTGKTPYPGLLTTRENRARRSFTNIEPRYPLV